MSQSSPPPRPPQPKQCQQCGAWNYEHVTTCWLCSHPLGGAPGPIGRPSARGGSSPDTDAVRQAYASPRQMSVEPGLHERRKTSAYVTLCLTVLTFLVAIGLFLDETGAGIVFLLVAGPALAGTYFAERALFRKDRPVHAAERVGLSLAVVLIFAGVMVLSGVIALGLVCVSILALN